MVSANTSKQLSELALSVQRNTPQPVQPIVAAGRVPASGSKAISAAAVAPIRPSTLAGPLVPGIHVTGSFSADVTFIPPPTPPTPIRWWTALAATFQDSACTVPAIANGAHVLGWGDVSGNNDHARNPTGLTYGVLETNSLNGRPVVRAVSTSPGGNTHLDVDTPPTVAADFTVYYVVRSTGGLSCLPFGSTVTSMLGSWVGTFYFINDAGAALPAGVAFPAGDLLVRFRRDVANACFVQWTGHAEISFGTQAGNFSPLSLFGRPAGGNPSTVEGFGDARLFGRTLSGPEDSLVLADIQSVWGVAL